VRAVLRLCGFYPQRRRQQ